MITGSACKIASEDSKPFYLITNGARTESHPFPPAEGLSSTALYVDGTEGASITLIRGKKYEFRVNTNSSHPVYLTDSAVGGGDGVGDYSDTGEDFDIFGGKSFNFKPNDNTPNFLYYQCANHDHEGYRILVEDED